MEIQGTLMAFAYANVFRTYHLQITGKEPMLMQYGLTLRSQERLHRAVTQRLSPTLSFDDVYLALVLDDMEREPRPVKYDEKVKRVPVPVPHFENGMHHERVFDPKAKVDPRYLALAPETDLRQNY